MDEWFSEPEPNLIESNAGFSARCHLCPVLKPYRVTGFTVPSCWCPLIPLLPALGLDGTATLAGHG